MDYTGDLHSVIFDQSRIIPNTPERALLQAIMLRALLDMVGSLGAINSSKFGSLEYHNYTRALRKDAYKWVFHGRKEDDGITFELCCEGLGLDMDAVRAKLRPFLRSPSVLKSRICRIKDSGHRSRVCRAEPVGECN
jgi:hypothetical protein